MVLVAHFAFLGNVINNGVMSINDSSFDNVNSASNLYVTSSFHLNNGNAIDTTNDTTYVKWNNNAVVNYTKVTLIYTPKGNDIDAIFESNCNISFINSNSRIRYLNIFFFFFFFAVSLMRG